MRHLIGLMREEIITVTSSSSFIECFLCVKCLPYIIIVMTANINYNRL